jgi:hypothetical protein
VECQAGPAKLQLFITRFDAISNSITIIIVIIHFTTRVRQGDSLRFVSDRGILY